MVEEVVKPAGNDQNKWVVLWLAVRVELALMVLASVVRVWLELAV